MKKKRRSLEQYREDLQERAPGGRQSLPLKDRGDGWTVIGAVSDSHLGSKHYRPDVLHYLYDRFADEGVEAVYHAGNWIEGESRLNRHDIKIFGLDDQIDYMVQEYPQRKGITTYYISGDDHEGWYQQRERISIGQHLQDRARSVGRNDLVFLGYLEADVDWVTSEGKATLRVMHGGGGTPYALSYPAQKTVESFQSGEKPDMLILGHYHKMFHSYVRSVHVVQPGCTQDQSIFMRKKGIEAHVGGAMVYVRQHAKGFIMECAPRFMSFYDEAFTRRHFDVRGY